MVIFVSSILVTFVLFREIIIATLTQDDTVGEGEIVLK